MSSRTDKLPRMTPPTPPRERIGLIGLGLMGSALMERLRSAGFDMLGWDIDPACDGRHAQNAAEVFEGCERVVLSLPNLDISAAVLAAAPLRREQCIIDTTTGDAESSVELGERHAAYLDAPISGSSAVVRAGEATIFVGGAADAVARCDDLFRAIARRVVHAGASGSGTKLKLVTNLVLGLNRAALAEGLVFARALGIDANVAFEAMRGSAAYSRIMDAKGSKMLSGDFTPEARLSQHLKDVRIMLASGARLPLTEAHRALLERAEALGFGALDNSAIIKALE